MLINEVLLYVMKTEFLTFTEANEHFSSGVYINLGHGLGVQNLIPLARRQGMKQKTKQKFYEKL